MDEKEYLIGRPGFSKLFHIETMRRILVDQDQETKDIIGATTHEGRLFPQALSDEFGKLPQVEHIVLRACHKKKHFAVAEEEEGERLLEVDVYGVQGVFQHRFLVNIADLYHVHTSGWHSFQAGESAKELVRLYKQAKGID